ncbi:MAG TPA: glycine zipper 2TM domain-containing protein [Gemmatimonadaceae bacterium]|nr:glycine zipper 2TM domain-containing protein [Gemmatimonadaceae bacterium]
MHSLIRFLPALSALALLAACRDRASTDSGATDSALVRDLAMAQREAPPQTVFNDAPVGGAMTGTVAPAPPTPRRAPAPRRESPTAPVVRTPRPAPSTPVERAPSPAPPSTTASAPGPAPGVIGVGARVGMTTNGRTCTSALVGDKFTATVSAATVGSNGAVIPAGSTVVLEVISVEHADPVEMSRIRFHVRAIDVNGEPLPADGEVTTLGQMEVVRVSKGNDRTKVVGGAIAGAVLGGMIGKSTKGTVIGAAAGAAAGTAAAKRSQRSEACLPEGSELTLTLSREIVVRREGTL